MIASTPVRLLSLAIGALVVIVGVRGIVGGFAFSGDMLDTSPGPTLPRPPASACPASWPTSSTGDTVQVTTGDRRDVRVRFLGVVH